MFNFFNKNLPFRRNLVTVLIITMLFISGGYALLMPKPAEAFTFSDAPAYAQRAAKWTWDKINWAWQKAKIAASLVAQNIVAVIKGEERVEHWADIAMQIVIETALRTLMARLTNDIVAWVQNGYKGKPGFMSGSFGDYLKEAADAAGGDFVTQYLGAGWLCDEIDFDFEIPLLQEHTFDVEARCTLSDIGVNLTDFYDDFAHGGWKGWIELTKPKHNFYGAILIAQSKKQEEEGKAGEEADKDVSMGQGFLSVNKCTWYDKNGTKIIEDTVFGKLPMPDVCDPKSPNALPADLRPCRDVCLTQTPSSVVSNVTNKSMTAGMDRINQTLSNLAAKGGSFFKPYIMAIGEAMINKLITDGLAKLKGDGPSKSNPLAALPTGTALDDTTGAGGRLAIPADTRQEMVPVATLLINLQETRKSLNELWINQQKAYNAVKNLKISESNPAWTGIYGLLAQKGVSYTPYDYVPVEMFSLFNYLHPALSGARDWYDICAPNAHRDRWRKRFERYRNEHIARLTNPFDDEGVTRKRIDLEEFDKDRYEESDNTVETKDSAGNVIKTVQTITEKETADYTLSINDIISDGLMAVETAITTITTSQKNAAGGWDTGTKTTYDISTEYSWIDWFINITDQSGNSIDLFEKSTNQEALAHIEAVFTDFTQQFKDGPDETKKIILEVEQATDYLKDEYIPAAEKYLELYEENLEDFDDPDLLDAEADMLDKEITAIIEIQEINSFNSDNFEDLNEEMETFFEEVAAEEGNLTQLLGDKQSATENSLYGLNAGFDDIMPNLVWLYVMCRTGRYN